MTHQADRRIVPILLQINEQLPRYLAISLGQSTPATAEAAADLPGKLLPVMAAIPAPASDS